MQAEHIQQHVAQARATGARQRDIAQTLGISEAALLAAHHPPAYDGALQAQALQPDWPGILRQLATVGEVMALTRNAECVQETIGRYQPFSQRGQVGLVLGQAIDLRLFLPHWAHGFAVRDQGRQGTLESLQFFDRHGTAIHKVFRRPESDQTAWQALCQRFAASAAPSPWRAQPADSPTAETPDAHIDIAGLQQGWASLRDTHDFHALLQRYGVTRRQALRLADSRFAQALPANAGSWLLQEAARRAVPIMVFTGNAGCIQIRSGSVHNVRAQGPWINVLDPQFNLHLRQDLVHEAWLVRKPTRDGLISSLELLAANGDTIALLFGVRKPGQPERADWRTLLQWLQDEVTTCLA